MKCLVCKNEMTCLGSEFGRQKMFGSDITVQYGCESCGIYIEKIFKKGYE